MAEQKTKLGDGVAMANEMQTNDNGAMQTVVVIEDQQAIAELLCEVLDDAGYTSHCAPTAIGAAKFCREVGADIVLLDVMMPDLSGWAVLDELRSHPHTRETPVVITSAVYDRPGLHPLPPGGPIRFAAKPFDIATLVDTVNDLIA
jgi:two-component system copper resistance phosphate regulon response regulator CusR